MKKQILLSALWLMLTFTTTAQIIYVNHEDVVYQPTTSTQQHDFDVNGDQYPDVRLEIEYYNTTINQCYIGNNCPTGTRVSFLPITNPNSGSGEFNAEDPPIGSSLLMTGLAIDCTNDTLTTSDPWESWANIARGCGVLASAADVCWSVGYGNHKLGVKAHKISGGVIVGYTFSYIDYSFNTDGTITIHGVYYINPPNNQSIIVNSLYDQPSAGGVVYDSVTVYDTITTQIFDTTYVTVYDSVSVTDTLFIDVPTLGNPTLTLGTIKVYPNPANEILFVYVESYSNFNGYKIRIENSSGQLIQENDIVGQTQQYDLSTWQGTGLYYIKVIDSGGSIAEVRKIVLE